MLVNYYQPDSLWSIFGVSSEEEYVDKFVVKGLFHANVHKDVSKSYQVVEHALALSYFHYPMYDLAIDKLLRIFEMAVKLRCNELGIEKALVNSKGKKRTRKLYELINDLIALDMVDDFSKILHNIKEIRNHASHPDHHSNMGAMAGQVIYPILNLINLIFVGKEAHIENHAHFEKTKSQILNIGLNLFILEQENQMILVYDIEMHDCYKQENDWIYIFSFMPVLIDAQHRINNHQPPERIVRFIKNPTIDEVSIEGYELTLEKNIVIEKTEKPENLEKFQSQLNAVREAEKTDAYIFMNGSKLNVDRKSQQFIYENRWGNNTLVGTTKTN